MFESIQPLEVGRNLVVYAIGVAILVVAALGLADAIDLSTQIAIPLFALGLILVIVVHEVFDGPF
ncbi:hypothetical protein [Natrarchaeobaculum aegyptiacum]|uniref:Uncharacterized protein n=1 Tax=Natrarchaeobaculum aegyptiacum TaxID=745377 RepID=A0A2Z2HX01_9EURY|nr:hypothetical protein [Natrarchaeobaculum aegyptiacum]ARS91909.1 hypothetical protein B1756_16955 [Natrarchaeobaculum aegyptiacum]